MPPTQNYTYPPFFHPMAQFPSCPVLNKPRQLPLIPIQNEQDLSILQLSIKHRTNGPPPAARMQLMVKRPPGSPQISPPPFLFGISHKHRQHHKLPQTHLPSTPRRRPRKINLTILFMYIKHHCKLTVKLCKYPVVYLDGKTRVENNKRKFKNLQRYVEGLLNF